MLLYNPQIHSLCQRGADHLCGQRCGQRQLVQQTPAAMPEDPLGQPDVRRLDVRLEHGQHRLGHLIAIQRLRSMAHAFRALGIELLLARIVNALLHDERRLHGQTARAADQIVAMQELQRIVEALLTDVGQLLRLARHQNASQTAHILHRHLDAGVGEVELKNGR